MKNTIGIALLLAFAWSSPTLAQDVEDSEFTTMVLAQENAGKYRPAPGKFLRSDEGIEVLGITLEQTSVIEETKRVGRARIDQLEKRPWHTQTLDENRALSAQINEATKQLRSDLLMVLSSDQRKRLAQVSFQKYLSSSRSLEMYLHRSVQSFIQLTDTQRTELQKKVTKANAEYHDELVALNEKYRQKILDGVGDSIAEKVDPVVGEVWFRFQSRGKSVLSNDIGSEK